METLTVLEEFHSTPRLDPAAQALTPDSKPHSLLSSDLLLLRYELEMRLDAQSRNIKR